MRGNLFLFIIQFVAISLWGQSVSEIRFNDESTFYFDPSIYLNKASIPSEFIDLKGEGMNGYFLSHKLNVEDLDTLKNQSQDFTTIKSNQSKIKRISQTTMPLDDIRFQNVAQNTMFNQKSGFVLMPTGALSARAIYASHGLSQSKVKYYIDGIPIEFFGSAHTAIAIPLATINRVEIHNKINPISLLTDKYEGAINFRTRENPDDKLDFSYAYGSYNTHQVSASGFSRDVLSGLTFRGNVFINYSDNEYRVWNGMELLKEHEKVHREDSSDLYRFNDAFYSIGGRMEFGFSELDWADQFYVGMLYGNLYDEVQHDATMEMPYGERYYRKETMMPSLIFQKENLIWDGLDVNFFTAYSIQHTDVNDVSNFRFNWMGEKIEEFTTGQKIPALSFYDDDSFINRISLDYQINKKNSVTLSNAFSSLTRFSDNLKIPEGFSANKEEQRLQKNILGIAYHQGGENKPLKTTFFGKYFRNVVNSVSSEYDIKMNTYYPTDYKSETDNFGYGVVLKYDLNANWFLQSSFERTVTMPEADKIFGNESLNILSSIGSENIAALRPEISRNTYLSFFFKSEEKADHLFHVGTHLIFRDVSDYIQADIINVGGVDYFLYENHEKIISKGLEFQIDYKFLNRVDASLSGSFMDSRNNSTTDSRGQKSEFFKYRLKNEPYVEFNAGVSYRTFRDVFMQNARFTFSWNMRYIHEYLFKWDDPLLDEKSIIPSQFVNNFSIMYGFPNKNTFFSLEGRNVFDTPVYSNYKVQLPGRGFFLKCMVKF